MQVKHTLESETEAVMTVVASDSELAPIKQQVLSKLSGSVKITGFREGKAPLELVEKNINQSALQSEFLEEAINQLYPQAVSSEKLRPVDRPEISIKKFVPFSNLEFEAKMPVVGSVKVADYKKIKMTKPKVTITAANIDEVISNLKTRMSEKKDVDRAAKEKDQVWIDFVGVDEKKQPIKSADGKNYPIVIGSNTFIPGFEPELVGMKAGQEKTFTLTFPKDYGVKAMASKKVTFTVTLTKVQEVIEPKTDDTFAAQVGPFKTLKELKDDIKAQLKVEREAEALRNFESELVREVTAKSQVAIPEVLITDQIERMMKDLNSNLVYRGQTIQEFLEAEGMSEEEYRKNVVGPQAQERVKASLVLTEISELEGVDVTHEEIDHRIQELKIQYQQDKAMQEELSKPDNHNEIGSRILTEKTVAKLTSYATS